MEKTNLSRLPVGGAARVEALAAGCGMRARLLELGFTAGARVECLYEAPRGNPRAYRVRGAVIALRRGDARSILLDGGSGHHE